MIISYPYAQKLVKNLVLYLEYLHGHKQKTHINEILYFLTI